MISAVFTDFYKPLNNVDKKIYQPPIKTAKKRKYALPLTIAGTAIGVVYPIFKANKNLNMQYAVFAKDKLKPLMTDEFDKTHKYPCVPRFSKNPVSHIKGLKDSLKNCEEDIQDMLNTKATTKWSVKKEQILTNTQADRIKMSELLNEYKILFININQEFKNQLLQKTVKKVLSAVLILSTVATAAGMAIDKIIEKRGKN